MDQKLRIVTLYIFKNYLTEEALTEKFNILKQEIKCLFPKALFFKHIS